MISSIYFIPNPFKTSYIKPLCMYSVFAGWENLIRGDHKVYKKFKCFL